MATDMSAMPTGRILLERHGAVAVIRLHAPERRNALDPEMADDLVAACGIIARDESCGAAVIFGSGAGFCSGAVRDVLAHAGEDPAEEGRWDDISRIYHAFTAVGELPVPTIAALDGAAVGAGMNLALATDIRIVTANAMFRSGFMEIGIHPGGGHLHLLERQIGRGTAAAIGVFGADVRGSRAVELGLAWSCVTSAQLEEEALSLAARVAADPALARQLVLSFRMEASGVPWDSARHIERSAQMWSLRRRAKGKRSV
ncbi:enoyl-CoA hydratase [Acrocarpospora pleiomorpha]|uniref:Enoyl-CoA hydratase n=1 Tax=Acrocarpospora pleiomorpha TaxID=90975 RepID=A0A5M3XST8_9ACTN|nr:enoyl-CoA hydratase-related protein [Acrocarpospora pleiomorpha]GES23896.1 enoyl-CoA hydratase [Acrocarpospora pleiomorpha]